MTRFGGIPLRRKRNAVLHVGDPPPVIVRRKELIHRFLARRCEICQQPGPVQMRQVRKVADLTPPGRPARNVATADGPTTTQTLVVCQPCHDTIHVRHPPPAHVTQ